VSPMKHNPSGRERLYSRQKMSVYRIMGTLTAVVSLLAVIGIQATSQSSPAWAAQTYAETTGSTANTWTDYADAGGSKGPQIASNQTVDVTCRVNGFAVADGNTWWYQIASSPWDDGYYASADAFYNNGQTTGSLQGTPFYDPNVPICVNRISPFSETTGDVTRTWKNYKTAGGAPGQEIALNQTVGVTCRAAGFRVADGNTWWYKIASAPWDNAYWASADAFYNNGQTTGSLVGTPFYDPGVPVCPVKITTPSALSATNGTPYSKILSATGGELPYTWSLTSGSLAPGLQLSKTGKILGTPTQAGTWRFTVAATDSSTPGLIGSKTLKLTIKP